MRGAFLLVLVLACCHAPTPPKPPATIHAVLEPAWQGDGVWFYPRERYDLEQTGVAAILADRPGDAHMHDGAAFDQNALIAAHQTLQLPAVVAVTNLQNGHRVLVQVDDRGPADPHRLIAVSRRAGTLLGIPPGGAAPVRLVVDEDRSRHLFARSGGSAPKLALSAAPRVTVQAESLDAPGHAVPVKTPLNRPETVDAGPAADRLPDDFTQVALMPGTYWIRAGEFSTPGYAARRRVQLGSSASVDRTGQGRFSRCAVKAGPFATIAAADAALDQALRAGVTDAHIVVE